MSTGGGVEYAASPDFATARASKNRIAPTVMKPRTRKAAAMAAPLLKRRPVPGSKSVDIGPFSVREVSSGSSQRSVSCGCIGPTYYVRIREGAGSAAQQPIHGRHEDQRRKGREQQAADHRPA